VNIAWPYRIDTRNRTALAEDADHIEQMIEQFLFTAAGERVMLPEFGSGIMQMVFGPNSAEVAAALGSMVQGGLQRWLGAVVDVRDVTVTSEEATLRVNIVYSIRRTQQTRTRVFERNLL
jgi:phage baseplate assembly protein W